MAICGTTSCGIYEWKASSHESNLIALMMAFLLHQLNTSKFSLGCGNANHICNINSIEISLANSLLITMDTNYATTRNAFPGSSVEVLLWRWYPCWVNSILNFAKIVIFKICIKICLNSFEIKIKFIQFNY